MPNIAGERHYRIAQEIRRNLTIYEELKDIIAMLGINELSREDQRTVFRARRLERFFTQPFHVTEQFIGKEGRWSPSRTPGRLRADPERRVRRLSRKARFT